MYTQNSINPSNSHLETFHDVFQRTLNSKSNSRPPKFELTGVLIPLGSANLSPSCYFKLATDSREYLLSMSDSLASVAEKMEWEQVKVKGYLDFDAEVFEVEKISLFRDHDLFEARVSLQDRYFDLGNYESTISPRGKLDLEENKLVS